MFEGHMQCVEKLACLLPSSCSYMIPASSGSFYIKALVYLGNVAGWVERQVCMFDCFGKNRNPQCLQATVTDSKDIVLTSKVRLALILFSCCFACVLTPRSLLRCKYFLCQPVLRSVVLCGLLRTHRTRNFNFNTTNSRLF